MSWKQHAQQNNRRRDGRYDRGPQCDCCGRPAGHDYGSHSLTDMAGEDGENFGDVALVLCRRCQKPAESARTVTAFMELRKKRWKGAG